MIKKIVGNILFFKLSFWFLTFSIMLATYNMNAYFEFIIRNTFILWILGISIILSIIFLLLLVFVTPASKLVHMRVASYFLIVGLSQIIICMFKIYQNNFSFDYYSYHPFAMYLSLIYIAFLIFGIFKFYHYKLYVLIQKHPKLIKEIGFSQLFITISLQVLYTYPELIQKIAEFKLVQLVIFVLKEGPKIY